MPDAAQPLEPERLLAEMDWARRLARALVGELAADDVTQEALRIALEKPPALTPGTSLRAWLRGVIANLARSQGERSVRRAYHEQRAARAEGVEPELAGFERVLEQRKLADAVLALDEPYRSAIALRYFDDLTPRAIAARQGVSYEAARQRISRGLAMLRVKLAREDGSHQRNWMLLAALPAPSGVLVTSLGGAWMSGKLALAGVAILVLLGGWWWRESASKPAALEVPVVAAGGSATEAPSDPAPDAGSLEARTRVAAPESGTSGGGAPEAVLDRDLALGGIVVDPAGKPIAGAEIRVRRNPLDEIMVLDLAHARDSYAVADAQTDAGGEFALAVPQGRTLELHAAAAGFAEFRLAHCHAGERVKIVLQPAAVVHGRVVRKEDGSPVADAEVQLLLRGPGGLGNTGAPRAATTDGRGAYRIEGIAAGRYTMRVYPRLDAFAAAEEFEIVGGQELRKDFSIERGHTLRGRVTEAGTGTPIPGARVGEGWTAKRNVTTDANGEYVFEGFATQGFYDIDVTARGYGRKLATVRAPDGPFPERLDVELERARSLAGRVVDASGAPIEGAYVAAVAYLIDGGHDWESFVTGADGRFEIATLAPDAHHALWVRRESFASFLRQLPEREVETPRFDVGDVVLVRGSSVFGTVIDEAKRPVPGMNVELDGNGAEFNAWEPQTFGEAAQLYLGRRSTRCDDLGRFSFSDLSAGEYEVVALRADSHDRIGARVHVGKEETVRGFELVVAQGMSISGRLRGPRGEAVVGYVSVDPEDAKVKTGTSGDVHAEPDGSFRVTGLAAGSYALTAFPESLWKKNKDDEGDRYMRIVVRNVAAGSANVDVTVPRAAAIRGRVLDAAGAPLAGAVVCVPMENDESLNVQCDADGSFIVWVPQGAPCDLYVDPKPAAGTLREGILLGDHRERPAAPTRRAVIGGGDPLEIRMP
ncbi:MAG TPA: sigma-70 family RNA polymerase sigma factor [Planctomycetota bacterium]|nr:sigma-70 family RNA polymerase sigma factor [Planctomycetota bacterium]